MKFLEYKQPHDTGDGVQILTVVQVKDKTYRISEVRREHVSETMIFDVGKDGSIDWVGMGRWDSTEGALQWLQKQ
jgi:hypothetical protein